MNHLKTFEKYSEKYNDVSIDFDYVRNLSDVDILAIYNEFENEYPEDDKKEAIINSLTNLRDYMKKHPVNEKLTLYRILSLKNIDDLDSDNLGEHYVTSLDDIDSTFLYDIGYKDEVGRNMYVAEIKVDYKYVNFNRTILTRIDYPHERELSLFNDEHIDIINVEKFKLNR